MSHPTAVEVAVFGPNMTRATEEVRHFFSKTTSQFVNLEVKASSRKPIWRKTKLIWYRIKKCHDLGEQRESRKQKKMPASDDCGLRSPVVQKTVSDEM